MRICFRGVQMGLNVAFAAFTASARFSTSADTPAIPKHTIEEPTSWGGDGYLCLWDGKVDVG
jgi:hypothetical protein